MAEEEKDEKMDVQEAARLIDWFQAKGLTAKDACECLKYIATGVGLPVKEQGETMAECNKTYVQNGNDSEGMTDCQYKGMLLDQLSNWRELRDLAIESGNAEIQKVAEEQIEKINKKLSF